MNTPQKTRGWKLRLAIEILKRELANGPRLVDELEALALAADISMSTLRRAFIEIRGVPRHSAGWGAPWFWELGSEDRPRRTQAEKREHAESFVQTTRETWASRPAAWRRLAKSEGISVHGFKNVLKMLGLLSQLEAISESWKAGETSPAEKKAAAEYLNAALPDDGRLLLIDDVRDGAFALGISGCALLEARIALGDAVSSPRDEAGEYYWSRLPLDGVEAAA